MKKLALFVFVVGLFTQVLAQNQPRVMIIPFNPDMYFSDSDQMLSEYNKKTIPEVRKMFRYGVSMNLNTRILSEYGSRSLLNDTTTDVMADLYSIYKNITYYSDESMGPQVLAPGEKPEKNKGFGKFFNKNNDNSNMGNPSGTQTTGKHEPRQYINVKIHSKELLVYLAEKYNVDVFLFVNQFNLVTNYEHCLDRANNVFQRDVIIHYSVFDANGNQMSGDIAEVHFPSNSNNMDMIMKENFPALADEVFANLPNRSKLGASGDEPNELNHNVKQ